MSGSPGARTADTSGNPGARRDGVSGRVLLGTAIVFLLVYFISRGAAEAWRPAMPLRILVALAPTVPLGFLLVMYARAVRSMDELHVRVNLEALAIAFPVMLLLLFVLGNLELVIALNRDDWSYRHVWALGATIYLGALALAWRRYR